MRSFKKEAPLGDEQVRPCRWPALSWTARCSLRASPRDEWAQPWAFRVDVDGPGVAAAMAHLGWSDPQEGEGEAAAQACASWVAHLVECASMLSAFEARSLDNPMFPAPAVGRPMAGLLECAMLEGRHPRAPGSVVDCSFKAFWSPQQQGRSAADRAQFWADGEQAAADMAATMVDALARLGASAKVGWSKGFGSGREEGFGQSRLPAKSLGWERGACLRAQCEGGEVWRALGAKEAKALGAAPLAKTFGPWQFFKLAGFSASVVRGLGGPLEGWSYQSGHAVGGRAAGPIRQTWRAWGAPSVDALEHVLQTLAPGSAARTQRHEGALENERLDGAQGHALFEAWGRAQMEALVLERASVAEKKASKPKGRRL
jgi:hypothetical protein